MADDLSDLKKGQAPVGTEFQQKRDATPLPSGETPAPTPQPSAPRTPSSSIDLGKVSVSAPIRPSVPPAPSAPTPKPIETTPSVQIKLGETEKAKSIAPSQPAIKVPPIVSVPTPQSVTIPSGTGSFFSRKLLLISILGVVVLGGAGTAYYFSNKSEVAETTPPPAGGPTTTTAEIITPTPSPLSSLESILGSVESLSLPAANQSGNRLSALKSLITSLNLSIGQISHYKLRDESIVEQGLSLSQLLNAISITHPAAIEQLGIGSAVLSVYGSIDGGKDVGIITPIDNPASAQSAMTEWEKTIAANTQFLFDLNLKKQASKTFLDNVYHGIPVRYLNFPNPESTIDYAIVSLSPELNFLVITNSRSQLYTILDRFQGQ